MPDEDAGAKLVGPGLPGDRKIAVTRKEMIPERQMIMGVDGDGEVSGASRGRKSAALDARRGRSGARALMEWLMGLRGGGPSTTHRPNLTDWPGVKLNWWMPCDP